MPLLNLPRSIKKRIEKMRRDYRYFGLRGLISLNVFLKIYRMLSKLGFRMYGKIIYFFVKGSAYPIILRYGTSDIAVLRQIFIDQEHFLFKGRTDFKLIIYCGAYVGYSSLYFLINCPNVHVIAVEPDEHNFDICGKNLYFYRKRVTLIHSAIYPYQTELVVYGGNYGDGKEWSTQVRETKGDEKPDILSVDMNTLIGKSGFDSVDLLKIDIEGSEIELFSHNYEKWLDKVHTIAIELHGKEYREIFLEHF